MTRGAGSFRPHHVLALVPAVALVLSPFVANRLEPRVFGMPFLLGWIVVWVLVTSAAMGIILRLDGDDGENVNAGNEGSETTGTTRPGHR